MVKMKWVSLFPSLMPKFWNVEFPLRTGRLSCHDRPASAGISKTLGLRADLRSSITRVPRSLKRFEFSRHSFGQLAAKSTSRGTLYDTSRAFDVLGKFGGQLLRALDISAQHDVGPGIRQAPLVGRADHGGFGDMGMPQQCVLHSTGETHMPATFSVSSARPQ